MNDLAHHMEIFNGNQELKVFFLVIVKYFKPYFVVGNIMAINPALVTIVIHIRIKKLPDRSYEKRRIFFHSQQWWELVDFVSMENKNTSLILPGTDVIGKLVDNSQGKNCIFQFRIYAVHPCVSMYVCEEKHCIVKKCLSQVSFHLYFSMGNKCC